MRSVEAFLPCFSPKWRRVKASVQLSWLRTDTVSQGRDGTSTNTKPRVCVCAAPPYRLTMPDASECCRNKKGNKRQRVWRARSNHTSVCSAMARPEVTLSTSHFSGGCCKDFGNCSSLSLRRTKNNKDREDSIQSAQVWAKSFEPSLRIWNILQQKNKTKNHCNILRYSIVCPRVHNTP